MPKLVLENMALLLQLTKDQRSSIPPTMSRMSFRYALTTSRGGKKKYVVYWPTIPKTWLVKIGMNLSKEKVFALEDAGFQLQQSEALSP